MTRRNASRKLERALNHLPEGDANAIAMIRDLQRLISAEGEAAKLRSLSRAYLFFAGFFQWLFWRWRLNRATIDPNAKCPCCGARKGSIRFEATMVWADGSKGAALHHCDVCHAIWAEKPIVKAEAWRIEGAESQPVSDVPFINKPRVVTSSQARERQAKPVFKEA